MRHPALKKGIKILFYSPLSGKNTNQDLRLPYDLLSPFQVLNLRASWPLFRVAHTLMAVYTEVSDTALAGFLADYDLGQLLAYKGIAEGVEIPIFCCMSPPDSSS